MSEQVAVTDIQTIIKYVTTLLKNGQAQEAMAYLEGHIKSQPKTPALLHIAAQIQNQQGHLTVALDYLNQAIAAAPEHLMLLVDRLHLLERLCDRKSLLKALAEATGLAPDNQAYQQQLARFYTQLNMPEQALAILKKFDKRDVGNLTLTFDEALNRWFTGDIKGAEKLLVEISADAQAPSMAFYVRSVIRKQTKAKNHIDELQKRARNDQVVDVPIWFALAKEFNDIGDFAAAAEVAKTANALQKQITPYNEASELAALKDLADVAGDWKASGRGNKKTSVTPIFVVSMPNSGATLVERYLASHSKVKSLGEFSDFPQLLNQAIEAYLKEHPGAARAQALQELDYTALGKAYLNQVAELADGHTYIVDKLTYNFLYCGFIQKALPTAKIIHVEREALDTCASIYRTLYVSRNAYAYDQAEIGRYYQAYQDVMAAWKHALGDNLLTVSYEQMLTDTDATVELLSTFCGLDKEAAQDDFISCVPSVSTARGEGQLKKVYKTALGSGKDYAKYLPDLVTALGR
jgi:Flp pilus assembly protein TadD